MSLNLGNFRALLRYRVKGGDNVLAESVKRAPSFALYVSPQIQNEFITIIGNEIIDNKVMERIQAARFFTIMGDETTDIKRICQLSLCARYLDVMCQHMIL